MKSNDLSCFQFCKTSSGCYRVTYTTPFRGDYWVNTINDMTLIDATKNAECAKIADIKHLRNAVKRGAHYSSKGQRIYNL